MRGLSTLAGVLIIGLGLGAVAEAATLEWEGSAMVSLATLRRTIFTGTGVATVNGSGGLGDLTQIRLAGGITGTTINLLTDPRNPTLVSLRVTGVHLGTGTITGISGGAVHGNNTLPVPGTPKLCVLFPGCANYLPIPFTVSGTMGIGIGATITVNALSKGNGAKISLIGAPWTLGVTSITDVETINGAQSGTTTMVGFIHGPESATSSAAALGGVIQMVAIQTVLTNLTAPGDDRQALLSFGRFHFVPEPSLLLLLGSGVAGLVMLGAGRARP